MVSCISVWTSDASMHILRKIHTPATNSGGPGEHGGIGAFLVDGFQVRLLADPDGLRITTVHGLHRGEPRVL